MIRLARFLRRIANRLDPHPPSTYYHLWPNGPVEPYTSSTSNVSVTWRLR